MRKYVGNPMRSLSCAIAAVLLFVGVFLSLLLWGVIVADFLGNPPFPLSSGLPTVLSASVSTLVAVSAGIYAFRKCGARWP